MLIQEASFQSFGSYLPMQMELKLDSGAVRGAEIHSSCPVSLFPCFTKTIIICASVNSGGIMPLDGHPVHVNYMFCKVILALFNRSMYPLETHPPLP